MSILSAKSSKTLVNTQVRAELWMEGHCQLIVILYRCYRCSGMRQYGYLWLYGLDGRSPDEAHLDGAEICEPVCGGETAKLTAVGIAANRYRQSLEAGPRFPLDLLSQQDQTSTGCQDWHPLTDAFLER